MIEEAYAFEKVMKRKQDISLTESKETTIRKCSWCSKTFDISKPPYNGREHDYCCGCWKYAANAEGLNR